MRRLAVRARVIGVARVLARVVAMVLGRVAGRPVVRVARRVVAGRAGVRGVGVGWSTRVRRWRVGAIRRGRGVMRRAVGAAIRAGSEGRRAHEHLRAYTVRMPCACRAHAVCAASSAPSKCYGFTTS